MIEQDLFQDQDGGSIPTSPLQFRVEICKRKEISAFIEKNHYSKSINGCISDFCFKLTFNGKLFGAMFFGRMAMVNQWKKFSNKECDVIELRRLCCLDIAPKNSESFFISKSLRWLSKNTKIKIVVTYADEEYGHSGIIYQASNFQYIGKQKGSKIIIFNGRKYHDKAIRTKYKGTLKPFALRILEAINQGTAIYKDTAGKHTYIYRLS